MMEATESRSTRPVPFPFSLAACLLVALACDVVPDRRNSSDNVIEGLRGRVLEEPLPKIDFTLTSTSGSPFSFREQTEGYVTLLFFGYTHCPDVCPIHMANIAAVLELLPVDVASNVKVVFVTTDPDRDSVGRIRGWLNNFSSGFIGLRGDIDDVNSVQRMLGLPLAVKEQAHVEDYTVGHAASVIAFTTDNLAHVMYPFGTRQTDWAHDLPKLVNGNW